MAQRSESDDGLKFWRDRLALHALEYGIPPVANRLPYMLGGLTFFSFVVLVVTGLVLAQFYDPSPSGAHGSVVYVMTRVPLGDFLRSLHSWAASAMAVTLVAHLTYVFYRRSYLRPREGTWWAGALMAAVLFLLVVTGTILRYDQEGFEALEHFRAGADLAGVLGAPFREDFTLSTPYLARIFGLHTSLLPIVLAALAGLHFWLIRHLGIQSDEPRTETFRRHLRRLVAAALFLLAGLALLAVIFPEELGYAPVPGAEVTKPFWPLLWVYGLENLMGLSAMVLGPTLVFGFLLLVPLADRHEAAGGVARRILTALGLVLLIGAVVLGVYAAVAPAQQHLGM